MRRSREPTLIAAFILIAALGAMGNFDYAEALNAEAEEKIALPLRQGALRAKLIDTSTKAATIGECERGGVAGTVLTINTSRDGIQWFRRSCLAPRQS